MKPQGFETMKKADQVKIFGSYVLGRFRFQYTETGIKVAGSYSETYSITAWDYQEFTFKEIAQASGARKHLVHDDPGFVPAFHFK